MDQDKRYYIEVVEQTAALSSTTTSQYIAKQQKGNIRYIELFTGNTTVADLQDLQITILTDGNQVLKNGTPLEFSTLFAGNGKLVIPVFVKEGGTVDISMVNAAAAAITFFTKFIYEY